MSNLTMSSQPNSAYLEIILGSMYSGKTSRLVEIYKQYKFCNIPVVVINHSVDTRYDILDTNILVTDSLFDAESTESTESLLSTHDKIKIPCIKTENLFDICAFDLPLHESLQRVPRIKDKFKLITSEVVLINEGQFFPDLEDFIKILLENNKKIYVCGLDGDFERKKFGQILNIIPLCDKVTKLTSLCSICKNGSLGIFSKRITFETEQTVVGSDNYIPVCRKCYNI